MKKIIITSVFFLFAFTINAQTFGASALEVNGTFSNSVPIFNTWLRLGNSQNVIMKFEQSAEGLKAALQLTQQLLFKTGLKWISPIFIIV